MRRVTIAGIIAGIAVLAVSLVVWLPKQKETPPQTDNEPSVSQESEKPTPPPVKPIAAETPEYPEWLERGAKYPEPDWAKVHKETADWVPRALLEDLRAGRVRRGDSLKELRAKYLPTYGWRSGEVTLTRFYGGGGIYVYAHKDRIIQVGLATSNILSGCNYYFFVMTREDYALVAQSASESTKDDPPHWKCVSSVIDWLVATHHRLASYRYFRCF